MNEEILKIARSMKRPIVHINPNYILGSDEDYCTLSKIEMDTGVPKPFTYHINDILTEDKKDKFAVEHAEEFLTEYIEIIPGIYINSFHENMYRDNIFELFNKVITYTICKSPIYQTEALEKNEEFMNKVAKLKVSDGMTTYILNNEYLITNFNKLHPINASDKVAVRIFDLDNISYLYEFSIIKKKYTIKEYIRYRKINRLG